jgi:hypothetical protein
MKNNKTKIFLLVASMAALIGFYSYNAAYSYEKNTQAAGNSVADSTVVKIFTCPMHPEIISEKAGDCPKCGMKLELKENEEKQDSKSDIKNDNVMEHKGCNGCKH